MATMVIAINADAFFTNFTAPPGIRWARPARGRPPIPLNGNGGGYKFVKAQGPVDRVEPGRRGERNAQTPYFARVRPG
jgi:hypothetical protein